jgi:purine-binding chemotaxis protein CheW
MDNNTESNTVQFVTLGIDQEVFAVPVDTVVEILDMRPMFRLPEAPPYLAGLIDVRGRSVPVIDLRVKLGLPATATTETTRILVLEITIEGRPLALGLIADRVFEVMGSISGRSRHRPTSASNGAPTTSTASGAGQAAS